MLPTNFNPNLLNPTQNYMPQLGTNPQNTLNRVAGFEGAKVFPIPPNSAVALFDLNDDVFYIKVSDGAGFTSSLTAYKFAALNVEQTAQPDYITRKEFDELKELISNGKLNTSIAAAATE